MDSFRDHNGDKLLSSVAKGDEKAFAKLFDLYKDKIYTVAFHITKSETSAEELVQDVFLTIWLKREQLLQIQDFESYFFIVAKYEAIRALKKALKQKELIELNSDVGEIPERGAHVTIHEYKDLLQKAIQKLSPKQRQVYQLIKEQGLTREEAAQVLNIEPETVKWHLKQAVRTIRAVFKADLKTVLFMIALLETIK